MQSIWSLLQGSVYANTYNLSYLSTHKATSGMETVAWRPRVSF